MLKTLAIYTSVTGCLFIFNSIYNIVLVYHLAVSALALLPNLISNIIKAGVEAKKYRTDKISLTIYVLSFPKEAFLPV